ncbi:MAG: glycosyltransferase [Fibromonadaceae bacterium]|jgi:glycosyltransferase involved in cell wall biosynthesis|nr:glycosyltransferase [Fibromonadaceae bacterium]
MKILYVLKSFPAGSGIDSVTRILGNELVKLGHNVFVCCFLYSKKAVFVNPEIKVYEFPDNWKIADSKNNISFLNQIINKYSINVIINQEADVYSVCNLCSKARKDSKAKLISCLHFSLFMNLESKGGIIARLLPKKLIIARRIKLQLKRRNFAYDNSDVFVMLSDRFVEQYKKNMPNKNLSKLRSISDTINYEFQNIDFSEKLKQLLVVSRIEEEQKRISLIIEIWKRISEKNKDWNLIIIGDGPDMEKSKKLAENLPRIDFKGWQEPQNYYLDSSVFLMTSSFEGFGITLIEAQNYGCVPVAMDSFLALHDIIENGKNGFVVPNNDINAFVEKVCLLIDNAALREEIAKNAINDCEKFDVQKIIKKWENLFMELST